MTTQKELNNLANKVNEVFKSAKNVVKMRKALKIAKEALEAHISFIEAIDWTTFEAESGLEDVNIVFDIQYQIEALVKNIENRISTRNWTAANWAFNALCTSNID